MPHSQFPAACSLRTTALPAGALCTPLLSHITALQPICLRALAARSHGSDSTCICQRSKQLERRQRLLLSL